MEVVYVRKLMWNGGKKMKMKIFKNVKIEMENGDYGLGNGEKLWGLRIRIGLGNREWKIKNG